MSRFDRIYKIHEILRSAHHPVPMRSFMLALEASRNTITRDFEYLRDTLGAPLEYCRESNGHHYTPDAPVFELPGFWMRPAELYALLACESLLENVQPGLISTRLAPLKDRIRNLLGETGHNAQKISERVRIQSIQVRISSHAVFDPIAEATLKGLKLGFDYASRSSPGSKLRSADPQRLLHYRSNWYLLALCSEANALRLFSLDRISQVTLYNTPSVALPTDELDSFQLDGFGIFGGKSKAMAHLRFNNHAAQWVADERWHPDQVGNWQDNSYHLHIPYSDERELIMEVLRYGADVEVLEPEELREAVAARIRKMALIY